MNMEDFGGTPHRGPSQAARERAVEFGEKYHEGMDSLDVKLQAVKEKIAAKKETLEKGRSLKSSLTDEKLKNAAGEAEAATLQEIVALEQEEADLRTRREGTQRSLQ